MKIDDYQKARAKILYKGPVYNPIKEGLKKGFNFLKLFWALIVLALIFLFIRFFGDRLGINL
jgi:hypothetical protein